MRDTFDDAAADIDDDDLEGFWRFAVGRLVVAALHDEGWRISAAPGEPLVCRRDTHEIELYREMEGEPGAWRQRCVALGIAGMPLAPAAHPASEAEPTYDPAPAMQRVVTDGWRVA